MSNNNSKLALALASIWILTGEIAPSALAQAGGSPFTVTNLADSGPGSLRRAILDANARPGPDVIDFAPGLHGTISLTSGVLTITDSLEINGPGAWWLIVNGNHASRVFEIEGAANTVTIAGLAITQGLAGSNTVHPGMGGGILLVSGSLTLSQVILSDNRAVGGTVVPTSATNPGTGGGGGIFNISGNLRVLTSAFVSNQAIGGSGGNGSGGGIFSLGPIALKNVVFLGNSALGSSGGNGSGGGIYAQPSALSSVENSLFLGNRGIGGPGMNGGGAGEGGGIFSSGNGTLTIANVTIIGNQALGGKGSDGGQGGNGLGGGLFNHTGATAALDNVRITDNLAQGGTGGTGGQGMGGGIYNLGNLTINTNSIITGNRASTSYPNLFPPN